MKVEIRTIITMVKIDKYHNSNKGPNKIDQEARDQVKVRQPVAAVMPRQCLEFSICKIRM